MNVGVRAGDKDPLLLFKVLFKIVKKKKLSIMVTFTNASEVKSS